jgi:hypothetical protein
MIQRATDPTDSRPGWLPAEAEARAAAPARHPPRSGHAWPFLSRPAEHAAGPQPNPRPRSSDFAS